jgi:hypothetical protein
MATEQSFSIGQVVYILSSRGQTIIPAMVIEEATVQTLNGKKVSWKFAIGAPGKQQKIVDSAQIDGDVFTSLDEVKVLLTARLGKFIETLLGQAQKHEEAWFGDQLRAAKENGMVSKTSTKIDPQEFLDGINMPSENYFSSDPKENARQKIREMVAVDESEIDDNTATYIDENGVKVRVQIQ